MTECYTNRLRLRVVSVSVATLLVALASIPLLSLGARIVS
jgi:hypothetical protein